MKLPQFSLRTLFISVLLICVILGSGVAWLRVREAEFQRQLSLEKVLESHRANAKWESKLPAWLSSIVGENASKRITCVVCQTDADVDSALDVVSQLPSVSSVGLSDEQLTGDIVKRLSNLGQLESLWVNMVLPEHYGDFLQMRPTNDRYVTELQTRLPSLSITWSIIGL